MCITKTDYMHWNRSIILKYLKDLASEITWTNTNSCYYNKWFEDQKKFTKVVYTLNLLALCCKVMQVFKKNCWKFTVVYINIQIF